MATALVWPHQGSSTLNEPMQLCTGRKQALKDFVAFVAPVSFRDVLRENFKKDDRPLVERLVLASDTTIIGMGVEPVVSREQPLSILHTLHMMLLCCCWPVHKCVTVLSCFDTLIVTILAYKSFNALTSAIHDPDWFTVLFFLFFLGFATCQIIATIFIILAHKRNIARYCYPRLALIAGLTICSAIACIVMLFYFGGAQATMNNFFFRVYEYFFEEVDALERAELKSELRMYAAGFFVLALTFCAYSLFELFLTRKFYLSLDDFTPIPQSDPSAPQPAFNPDFAQAPGKVYPNLP